MLGKYKYRVARAGYRRLSCKTSSMPKCNTKLEALMTPHQTERRLNESIDNVTNDKPRPQQNAKMEKLDV